MREDQLAFLHRCPWGPFFVIRDPDQAYAPGRNNADQEGDLNEVEHADINEDSVFNRINKFVGNKAFHGTCCKRDDLKASTCQ